MWHKKTSFDSINAIHKYFINQDDIIWYVLQYTAALWVTLATKGGTCVVLHPTVMCTGTTIPWNCSLFLWLFNSVLGQTCCDVKWTAISIRATFLGSFLGLLWVDPCFRAQNLCTNMCNFHQEWQNCQWYLVTPGTEWIPHIWSTVIMLFLLS